MLPGMNDRQRRRAVALGAWVLTPLLVGTVVILMAGVDPLVGAVVIGLIALFLAPIVVSGVLAIRRAGDR